MGASAALADAVGEHFQGFGVGFAGQFAERRGAGEDAVELVLVGGFGRDFGDHLLGEHLDRGLGLADAVQVALADGADHGGALDQFVERGGEERAVGGAAERVPGASDALEEGADSAGRADLADQVDGADVDAEFQGGGGDDGAQVAGLEPLLHLVAAVFGEAAVVAGDMLLTDSFSEAMGDALGERAGVDEDQRGAVLLDQLAEAVVDAVPEVVGGDGGERHVGCFDPELEFALVAEVEDLAAERASCVVQAGEEGGDLVHRFLGGGEADAHGALFGDAIEAGQGEGEVAAALVAHHCVDFVDDHGLDGAEGLAAALGGEHQIERFGRGDQDVRGALDDCLALGGRCVAGADGGADAGHGRAAEGARLCSLAGEFGDLAQGFFEVALDVVGERFERGDVEHARLVGQFALLLAEPHEVVDGGEECGERFAGAGGGGEQGVAAGADRGPAGGLGVGGCVEARTEPVAHQGVEVGQRVGWGVGVGCGGGHTF